MNDEFIEGVRDQVTPGTSALFAMTSDAVLDKVHDAFGDAHPELIFSLPTSTTSRSATSVRCSPSPSEGRKPHSGRHLGRRAIAARDAATPSVPIVRSPSTAAN